MLDKLLAEHKWIRNEKNFFNVIGTQYDFRNLNSYKLKEEIQSLAEKIEEMSKKVNHKVQSMAEKTEKDFDSLQKKRATV